MTKNADKSIVRWDDIQELLPNVDHPVINNIRNNQNGAKFDTRIAFYNGERKRFEATISLYNSGYSLHILAQHVALQQMRDLFGQAAPWTHCIVNEQSHNPRKRNDIEQAIAESALCQAYDERLSVMDAMSKASKMIGEIGVCSINTRAQFNTVIEPAMLVYLAAICRNGVETVQNFPEPIVETPKPKARTGFWNRFLPR